jgi:hypothetical protein
MLVVAQSLAIYQALRRWSVGADGPVFYWTDPSWSAPVPQWLLIIAFTAFVVWLFGTDQSVETRDDDLPGLRV